jgi:glycosyltransferase involved in cell wall biosynthesis
MRNLRPEQEIIDSWKGGSPADPLVSICCITYNHESFIEDALEGFLIQETDFPFEILINDDASTDRTAVIIREYESAYPNIIKPIYQTENQYSKGNKPGLLNRERAKGKYIALCEGDDYWTASNKLMKQIDFLEMNPEYSICFHSVKIWKDSQLIDDYITREVPETSSIRELANGNYIHTPSVVYRNRLFEHTKNMKKSPIGDYFLHMMNAKYGKIKKIHENMAVYRVHAGGNMSSICYSKNMWMTLVTLSLMLKEFDTRVQEIFLRKMKYLAETLLFDPSELSKKETVILQKIMAENFPDFFIRLMQENNKNREKLNSGKNATKIIFHKIKAKFFKVSN